MKEETMISNLYRRISIWWADILGWDWKRKRRKRWKFEGNDD